MKAPFTEYYIIREITTTNSHSYASKSVRFYNEIY